MKYKFIFFFFFFSFSYSQTSKDLDTLKTSSIAFYYGYGFKTGIFVKSNYDYKPNIYIVEYKKELLKNDFLSLSCRFSAEYNDVQFCESYVSNPCITYQNKDYGLNISFDISKNISKKLSVYSFFGTGPHYIKRRLARQAVGLIFSDVLGAGFVYKFYKNTFIDMRYALRHLSNAGLARPNVGIENNILYIGIGKNLK